MTLRMRCVGFNLDKLLKNALLLSLFPCPSALHTSTSQIAFKVIELSLLSTIRKQYISSFSPPPLSSKGITYGKKSTANSSQGSVFAGKDEVTNEDYDYSTSYSTSYRTFEPTEVNEDTKANLQSDGNFEKGMTQTWQPSALDETETSTSTQEPAEYDSQAKSDTNSVNSEFTTTSNENTNEQKSMMTSQPTQLDEVKGQNLSEKGSSSNEQITNETNSPTIIFTTNEIESRPEYLKKNKVTFSSTNVPSILHTSLDKKPTHVDSKSPNQTNTSAQPSITKNSSEVMPQFTDYYSRGTTSLYQIPTATYQPTVQLMRATNEPLGAANQARTISPTWNSWQYSDELSSSQSKTLSYSFTATILPFGQEKSNITLTPSAISKLKSVGAAPSPTPVVQSNATFGRASSMNIFVGMYIAITAFVAMAVAYTLFSYARKTREEPDTSFYVQFNTNPVV